MKRLLLVAAIAASLAGCATTTSPTGRRQIVGGVSESQLAQLGAQAFAETKAKTPQTKDAHQSAYVRCVVQQVVAQLPPDWQRLSWETAVFVDSSPNAFALPGGKVGVNTGIFTVAKNQDQLAAVVAHEVGHVYSHHHDERITRQLQAQFGLNVAAAILGGRYGEGAANATSQLGGIAAQTLFLLPNSRTQESEADVVGQQLMARAGFDPRQAVDLWENMIAASRSRPPEFLSTHPNPEARIQELGNRAASLVPVYQQARSSGHTPRCG
ncbi:M48 family metallopeptidase [Lysobacter yangpyeongensis]|uniref:M48 family metallopeptidase n=1 Tax=Lysobacter yangpyeongensis TaxID=346182 RepID=A0ABW0SP43_9GAMM